MARNPKPIIEMEIAKKAISRLRRRYGRRKGFRNIMKSLRVINVGGKVKIHTPYFWAVYVHQGRGPVNRMVIYYRKPLEQDPRLRGRYPVTRSQVRHLTKAEFVQGMMNQPDSGMFVAEDGVGPVKPRPFFHDGLIGFQNEAQEVAKTALKKYLREELNALTKQSYKDRRIRIPLS